MELRELKYFLAVADTESFTKAAEISYVTQPNLSRQMQKLEEEIGQKLFIRGNRKVTLTEAGTLLRKRAEEILALCRRTESELSFEPSEVSGDLYIGGGESYAVRLIADAAKATRDRHPSVRFHFFSGDTLDVTEKLDKGLFDFGILIEPADLYKYDRLRLPLTDTWGVLMRKDSPLAQKDRITPSDLTDAPLIRSKHSLGRSVVSEWFQTSEESLHIAATYNLIYNASLLVEAGIGYAIGLDKLVNTGANSALCFRPLDPLLETHLDIAWKRQRALSKPAAVFLSLLREKIAAY